MRPETNKEIDLLLRRMSQGNGAARDGVLPDHDQHLDADELSSYAQNALPPAARARYMEHLADCSRCRRLITELSLSLGSAASAEPVEAASELSGWKKFLASLLSPMVLRYAVPALGVIVVLVAGFVVLHRQQRSDFTAQLEPRQVTAPSVTPETPDAKGLVNDSQPRVANKIESQNANADTRGTPSTNGPGARAAGAAPVTTAREEKSVAESRPAAAPEQPAPAAKTGAADTERQQETAAAAKKETEPAREKGDAAPKSANEAPRDQAATTASAAQSQPTPAPSSTSGFTALRGLSAGRAETAKRGAAAKSADENKDTNNSFVDDENRTIAGHRFRKQGKVWVDTTYQSPTATVNMARDSEQFRALVADEPTIGTIARQLDGEVIIVWKGHAYRIR